MLRRNNEQKSLDFGLLWCLQILKLEEDKHYFRETGEDNISKLSSTIIHMTFSFEYLFIN